MYAVSSSNRGRGPSPRGESRRRPSILSRASPRSHDRATHVYVTRISGEKTTRVLNAKKILIITIIIRAQIAGCAGFLGAAARCLLFVVYAHLPTRALL